jgi:hypothetical protein
MKALAKDPAERFQNGRELLDELEKCKESKPAAAKKAEAPKGLIAPDKAKAAAQTKVSSGPKPATPPRAAAAPAKPAATSTSVRPANGASAPVAKSTPVKPVEKKPAAPAASAVAERPATLATPVSKVSVPKAAAAAAGVGSSDASLISPEVDEIDLSSHSIEAPAEPTVEAVESSSEYMSAAVMDEPEVETFEPQVEEEGPKFNVDPLMSGGGASGSTGTSFSEISELPPLKEIYTPPPPPPPPVDLRPAQPVSPAVTMFKGSPNVDEKPKVQPREVAEKAIKEIKSVPPKLMLYSLAGAGALIVAIGIGFTIYVHNLGSDDDSGAARSSVPVATQTAAPEASQPVAPKPVPQPTEETAAPVAAEPENPEPAAPAEKRGASAKSRNSKKKIAAAPAIIPGQLSVDSTPQGAQVQVDGKSDPSWVTPFAMTNVQPGQHSVTISKPGYITDTRTVDVTGGYRATATVHLTQLVATLLVKSDPAGASIYVDGKDAGAKTPAQVSVSKGQHVVLVRMSGYIDETMSAQFVLGQTFNFSPTLRALGNVDSIKTVGKMSKLFGGGKGDPGQATLSIHTQPKGAQISVNQHMLDKNSPVDVMIDPGNYVVDITMTGYAPVHKVITADKKGKVVVDEVLQPQ